MNFIELVKREQCQVVFLYFIVSKTVSSTEYFARKKSVL